MIAAVSSFPEKSKIPLVSFITINYNSERDTDNFLMSCEQLSYPNFEVIVVDNASSLPYMPPNRAITFHLELIRSDRNLGFAGGNNLGLKAARGKYLIIVNNDTIVIKDFLDPIIDLFENHEEVGLVSPKVVYPDNITIQYAGAIKINPWTGRGKRLGLGEIDNGQYNFIRETDLGHGACLAVPRKIVEEVGYMPEEYFLYYEEHDWTEQIKKAGYKMYYVGTSKIIHIESSSTGQNSPLKSYYMMRSRILYIRRNMYGLKKIISLSIILLLALPKVTISNLIKGRFSLITANLKGFFTHLNIKV